MNTTLYNSNFSAFLNAARWISAFTVLITHLNNVMFLPLAQIPTDDKSIFVYG